MGFINKKKIPVFVVVIVGLFILYAILSSLIQSNMLNKYGKLGVAKLISNEKGNKGKDILSFELNVNGKKYKMDDDLNLFSNNLIDSFYKHGLPIVYSYKKPTCHEVLISKDDFQRFNIEVPSEYSFLP